MSSQYFYNFIFLFLSLVSVFFVFLKQLFQLFFCKCLSHFWFNFLLSFSFNLLLFYFLHNLFLRRQFWLFPINLLSIFFSPFIFCSPPPSLVFFGIILVSFLDHFGIVLGSFWHHFNIVFGSF